MAFHIELPPSWQRVEVPSVSLAAVRPGGDGFTPSLAVSQPLAAPTIRLLDQATGRSATAASWIEVLDTSPVVGAGPFTAVRRLRARADAGLLLQWLVVAGDGHGAVVHLAVSTGPAPDDVLLREVGTIIDSLAAVPGPD